MNGIGGCGYINITRATYEKHSVVGHGGQEMGNKTAIQVAGAFRDRRRMKKGNYESTGEEYRLFGNTIAERTEDGFYIQDCGWCSTTTATALNALPSVRLRRCKGEWIWNEHHIWDGRRIFVEYKD